jgi:hypothetical protein
LRCRSRAAAIDNRVGPVAADRHCKHQEESDHGREAGHVTPKELPELLMDSSSPKGQRTMQAMLQMKKLDIDALKRAYAG